MDAFLVPPQWLQDRLGDPGVVILDASWYLSEARRNARSEFEAGHIPGARFFDLDAASDPGSPYVNMLPPPAQFAALAGGLGIGATTAVVVHDAGNVSARVWWMFRHFGHE
ncbi:MAG: sulfurtransferase, partial [Rhodobacteraceae bacterium]|nr:sulfurtransferase [Paracoccaceae bacterium]